MAHLKQTLFSMLTLATLASGIALMPTPAKAGFQFSPAPKAGAAVAPTSGAPLPDNGPLMPMLAPDNVDADPLNRMPTPPLPSLPVDPLASGDMLPGKHVISTPISARASAAPGATATSTMPEAIGFGSDLPLVLGLRQIVPPQYAYAFDPGVDQGAKISWNGGKPWDIALSDALQPLGYTARVEGTTVHVSSGTSAMAAPVPAPVAPPMMNVRASGDVPRAPLSPAEMPPAATLSVTPAAAPIAAAPKPAHEVYVRRNASGAAAEPTGPKKDVVVSANNGDEKNLWDRINPMNWTESSESVTAPAYNVDRTGSTPAAAPAPQTPTGPMARMSDNDAMIAAENTRAPATREAQIPNAPDAVPDAFPDTAANAPVMLTRGPGEISKEAIPPETISGAAATAPASSDVLNTGAVMKWEAQKGDDLRTVLQDWSAKAKVQLYWVPAQDYKLPKQISMTGSYTDAVADLLGAYGEKPARPVGRLHPNLPNGPSVLIIEPAAS